MFGFHKKYYFIGSVRVVDGVVEDSRCWGFYTKKSKAIRAVEENWSDINEYGYYQYAVIETVEEGLNNYDLHPMWFVQCRTLDRERDYYTTTYMKLNEAPNFSKDVCGWCIS